MQAKSVIKEMNSVLEHNIKGKYIFMDTVSFVDIMACEFIREEIIMLKDVILLIQIDISKNLRDYVMRMDKYVKQEMVACDVKFSDKMTESANRQYKSNQWEA